MLLYDDTFDIPKTSLVFNRIQFPHVIVLINPVDRTYSSQDLDHESESHLSSSVVIVHVIYTLFLIVFACFIYNLDCKLLMISTFFYKTYVFSGTLPEPYLCIVRISTLSVDSTSNRTIYSIFIRVTSCARWESTGQSDNVPG